MLKTGRYRFRKPVPLLPRMEANTFPDPNTGCFLWAGCVGKRGYGVIGYAGKTKTAHRAAWEVYVGEIPSGMWVLHKCDNKICVNIDHLYIGTVIENSRDVAVRKRSAWLKKTHCPQGHQYSDENTYRYGGRRFCRACHKIAVYKNDIKRGHTKIRSTHDSAI